jgi:hypothetical protein
MVKEYDEDKSLPLLGRYEQKIEVYSSTHAAFSSSIQLHP